MEFRTMGYVTGPLEPFEPEEELEEKIVRTPGYGKEVCKKLKDIRDEEARKHHVDYKSEECPNMDKCDKPCQRCEAEAELLYRLIYNKG